MTMSLKEHGPVSIYDIARAAGVNPSTVSRALNNRDRIGTATRERIVKIARDLGYQPSAIARSLVTSRTFTVGVVAPFLSDPFLGKVIDGIEQAADNAGYRVLFSTSRYDPERELVIATSLQRSRVDAVIIVTTHLRSTYQLFEQNLNVPLVLIGQQDNDSSIPGVVIDEVGAIHRVVTHLHDLGHRSFAYIGVSDRPFSNSSRREAFISSVSRLAPDSPVHVQIRNDEKDLLRGRNALPALLESGATAVQCFNDMVAFGLIGSALEAGVSIPGDLSVVGFDDLDISEAFPVPLTTVHQPREKIGQQAMRIVLELLETGTYHEAHLEGVLVVRGSTGLRK
jgi:LacI family transcriptional regulator